MTLPPSLLQFRLNCSTTSTYKIAGSHDLKGSQHMHHIGICTVNGKLSYLERMHVTALQITHDQQLTAKEGCILATTATLPAGE